MAATTSYAAQQAWRRQMAFLPPALQWQADGNGGDVGLKEATFEWRGHAVHLDRFDVPDSPVQLILLHGTCVCNDAGLGLCVCGGDVASVDSIRFDRSIQSVGWLID